MSTKVAEPILPRWMRRNAFIRGPVKMDRRWQDVPRMHRVDGSIVVYMPAWMKSPKEFRDALTVA